MIAKLVRQAVEVDVLKQFIDSFSTHLGNKLVRIIICKIFILRIQMIVKDIILLFLCEEVELMRTVDFETVSISFSFQHTWTDHYILLIVDDSIQFLGRHTQEVTYLIRKGTEIPSGYQATGTTSSM